MPQPQILLDGGNRGGIARGIGHEPQGERHAVPDALGRQPQTRVRVVDRKRRAVPTGPDSISASIQ